MSTAPSSYAPRARTTILLAALAAVLLGASAPADAQSTRPTTFVRIDDMLLPAVPSGRGLAGPASVIATGITPWPGGVVPVDMAASISDEHRAAVFAACGIWSKRAAVSCVPYTGQRPYLRVTEDPDGCYSNLGALTGSQPGRMNLGVGCWGQKSVLHELGHVFGLHHEHQRADRDTYITINRAAVDPKYQSSFTLLEGMPTRGAYDFLSVMHYHDFAFAAKPLTRTMIPKPGFEWYAYSLGSSDFPSPGDGEAVQSIYGGGAPYWPARVQNLRIAGTGGGRTTIGWDPPMGHPEVRQYTISVYAGPSYLESSPVATLVVAPTATSAAFDLGAGRYFVAVRGDAADGEYARSTLLSFTIDQSGAAMQRSPGAPTLAATAVEGARVALQWAHGEGAAPTLYTVYAGTRPGTSDLGSFPMGTLTAITTTAPTGVTAYVRIVASNAVGAATSNEVSFYVPGPPSPTAPSLKVDQAAANPISLSWSGSPEASAYTLVAGTSPGGTDIGIFPMGDARAIVANAPVGMPLYVRVFAASATGTAVSNEVQFQVPAPWAAAPPSLLPPEVVGTTVHLTWSASDAAAYTILARSYVGGPVIAAIPVGRAQSIAIPGVPRGIYVVTVAATPGYAESNSIFVSVL